MPSTASPFGLRPAYHPSGTIRPEAGTILSTYATGIYQYAPIKIGTDGTVQLGAAGDHIIGCFMGVEYTDATGRRVLSNQWVAATTGTNIVAYYTRDPNIVYEIQSTAAVALADMGSQADWSTATAGNATTGLSSVALDASTLSATAAAGLRIIGLGREANNAWGDTYTNVLVQIAEHQDVATEGGY
jgi:hypothetical protein